jgi:hypothetical protein
LTSPEPIPWTRNWRIRQQLILVEIKRQEEIRLLNGLHSHWLAYLANGNLVAGGFDTAKTAANEALRSLREAIFPWNVDVKTEPRKENDTIIDTETQQLIDSYRAFEQELAAKNAAAEKAGVK